MNSEFWKDKEVTIAGGASFIASHTIPRLLEFGAKVYVFDDFSSGSLDNLVSLDAYVEDVDLRNYKNAFHAVNGADIVLDFASVHGGRGFVGTNHEVAISDNLIINTNVLKAAAECGVERYAFASSGCVYDTRWQMDEREDIRIPETWDNHDAPLFPDGMYGLSKAVHERVLRAYHNDGKIKAAICRFFTVFGPRMKENHFVLASIAKSFIKTDPYYVWGSPDVVRNFTPVQNTVEGFLLATEQASGEIYNIGLEQRITIQDALEQIWYLMDWHPKEVIYQPDKPVGIRNRVSDCTKARTELGWEPKVSFEQGLMETIAWYLKDRDVETVRKELEAKLVSR